MYDFLCSVDNCRLSPKLVHYPGERICGVPFEPLRRVLAYPRRSGRWYSCSARYSYESAAQRQQCCDVHISKAISGRSVKVALFKS
jgi:hypothetical protein